MELFVQLELERLLVGPCAVVWNSKAASLPPLHCRVVQCTVGFRVVQ